MGLFGKDSPDISVVVPVYNEEESLQPFTEALYAVLNNLNKSFECVFVNDGSSDHSLDILKALKTHYKHLKIISLRRNFGQTAAMAAGFDTAAGKIIVTLDADLQNDPQDIPLLLEKIEEGYDLVNGWRKSRKDPLSKKIPSYFANKLIAKVTGVSLHDFGCTLKAYRREVVKDLNLYGQMHRFIPALASWSGVNIIEIPVRHHPRKRGQSKYGIGRTLRVFFDLLTVKFLLSYSSSPIQFFARIGVFSSVIGFILFIVAVFLKFTQARTLTGNPLFYFFIFMEIAAMQFVLIGLLGEINIRTYHEARGKKTYVVKECI